MEHDNNKKNTHKTRSIYLLPNLVTTGALFAGFYSILSSINAEYERAAVSIFIAMLLDGIDGRVARLTGTTSAFGEQYDSLADLISFGVAPAICIYQWSLHSVADVTWLPEKLSWMVPFVYCACTALRLARFNTQIASTNPRYFIGLPSPSAAGAVAGFVWFGTEYSIAGSNVLGFGLLITFCSGLLMVAPIRYLSFKKLDLNGKISFIWMTAIILIIALISVNPATLLWFIFLTYAIHGPVFKTYYYTKVKLKSK